MIRLSGLLLTLIGLNATFVGCGEPSRSKAPGATKSTPTPVTTAAPYRDPREILVPGTHFVDRMALGMSPRQQELTDRMRQAAASDPAFFLALVAGAKSGEPLAYDPRLGVSEKDYAEYLASVNKMNLYKNGSATLTITKIDDDIFQLDGGQELPEFKDFIIDLKSDEVRTPFGTLGERSVIDAPENTPLGAWKGTQWKQEGLLSFIRLAVGKPVGSRRGIVYLSIKSNLQPQKFHILMFDPQN